MPFQIRQLQTHDEFRACLDIQKQVWGENFVDVTPPGLITIAHKIGGLAAGAFDEQNHLVGFVFGLTGVMGDKIVHWSQKLAVLKSCRGLGLGIQLKHFQRGFVLNKGIEDMYWTYDPLVARNAHMNLNLLGAKVEEYVLNCYAPDEQNELRRGIGTDRFVVHWHLTDAPVKPPGTTKVNLNDMAIVTETDDPVPLVDSVVIEIPKDIEAILKTDLKQAADWRERTRKLFQYYLERGYRVTQFFRQRNRCFYLTSKRSE